LLIVGVLNFVLGVALTGIQTETKLQQIEKSLNLQGQRLDRCMANFTVVPINWEDGCNETNKKSAPIAPPNAHRAN
jgi:hypothetical protein